MPSELKETIEKFVEYYTGATTKPLAALLLLTSITAGGRIS